MSFTPGPYGLCGDILYAECTGLAVARISFEHREQVNDNANLLKAAPEMFKALELVKLWMIGKQPGPLSDQVVLFEIEAAIAKAKGKSWKEQNQ